MTNFQFNIETKQGERELQNEAHKRLLAGLAQVVLDDANGDPEALTRALKVATGRMFSQVYSGLKAPFDAQVREAFDAANVKEEGGAKS